MSLNFYITLWWAAEILLGQNQRETQTEEGNYALSYFRLYQVSFVYKCSKNQENETFFLPKKSGETRPDEGGG